jgi:hypothetical protein
MDTLRGIWTYRSVFNVEAGAEPQGSIQLWQAELYLDIDPATKRIYGHIGERLEATPATGEGGKPYPYLLVEGVYSEGEPVTLYFRGIGRKNSAWESWVYDYKCVLAPTWPRNPDFDPKRSQKPVLIGTVIRTVAHDGAPAGASYSFYAVKHDFVEPRVSIPLPADVVAMLSSPAMRLHHQLWHASRDEWDGLNDDRKQWLREHNWQPGPAHKERSAGLRQNHLHNHSGEDFLFMHRRMLKAVKDIAGNETPAAWKRLPDPTPLADFAPNRSKTAIGNIDGFAIPSAWAVPDDLSMTAWLSSLRSPATYNGRFRPWETQYTNPAWLASVTLGELGAWIEFTIHNWMHMRWSSVQRDPAQGGLPVPGGRENDDFAEPWFRPENDHLGATFSSHLNPVFWRLHGWVDDRIEDWFKAHEAVRPGAIKRQPLKDVQWFCKDGKWVNVDDPWEGPADDDVHGGHAGHGEHGGHVHGHGGMDIELMKRAIIVIFRGVGALGLDHHAMAELRSSQERRSVSWFQNWE